MAKFQGSRTIVYGVMSVQSFEEKTLNACISVNNGPREIKRNYVMERQKRRKRLEREEGGDREEGEKVMMRRRSQEQ